MPPEAAYGRKGRVFVSVALTLELIGACGIMSILFMDNVNNLFPTFPRMYVAAIFVAIVLPTTWTTKLGLLSYVSIVGVISMFFLLFVLIYEGITEKSKNYGSLREPVETVRLKTLSIAFGLTIPGQIPTVRRGRISTMMATRI